MSLLPTKRLLVYVAVGLVVLVVGTVGLVVAGRGSQGGDGVVIQAGQDGAGSIGAAADGVVSPGPTETMAPTTTEVQRIWVQVAGAVHVPGVYQLQVGSRVFEAVAAAGGFTDEADQQAVALAAQLSDGCRVYVPKVGESIGGAVVAPAQSSAGVTGGVTTGGAEGGPLSINSATAEQLDLLPGIGPSLAKQIIAYRESKGPFTSVDQLADVPGIGPAKLAQLRPLVVL
jgi:competence protein ComEA